MIEDAQLNVYTAGEWHSSSVHFLLDTKVYLPYSCALSPDFRNASHASPKHYISGGTEMFTPPDVHDPSVSKYLTVHDVPGC
jgi:hypothetical protein